MLLWLKKAEGSAGLVIAGLGIRKASRRTGEPPTGLMQVAWRVKLAQAAGREAPLSWASPSCNSTPGGSTTKRCRRVLPASYPALRS